LIGSLIPVNSGEDLSEGVKIYIKTNGIHTDVCLPVVSEQIDWRTFIPVSDFPNVKNHSYISLGWGDKGFFLNTPSWSDLKFSTAFNAAFLGGETAMHVAYFENEPIVAPSSKRQYIKHEKYVDLIIYIKNSFKTVNGKVDLISGRGYWAHDNFYEANGSYHLFNTCNIWTNKALKIAGVRTPVLALFSHGIMRQFE